MRIHTRSQMLAALDPLAVIAAIEEGFAAYSKGQVTVPPVGHLAFSRPPGDVHIKYGHRAGDRQFVVKIASSFYDNPKRGLSSSNGVMLAFCAETGALEAVLHDEGYLTDLRTAAAGAVAAKYLGPVHVAAIGVVGAGVQAHMQLDMLRHVTSCRRAMVWARDPDKARAFKVSGFEIDVVDSVEDLAARCNLLITATPSRQPLLHGSAIRPGMHITAVGADSSGKQELDATVFSRAQVRAVDARKQCFEYGDSGYAVRANAASADQFVELGEIVADPALGRTHDDQITVADLTGLAVQDIQITKLACQQMNEQRLALV